MWHCSMTAAFPAHPWKSPAWIALIFYLCAVKITFAPRKSGCSCTNRLLTSWYAATDQDLLCRVPSSSYTCGPRGQQESEGRFYYKKKRTAFLPSMRYKNQASPHSALRAAALHCPPLSPVPHHLLPSPCQHPGGCRYHSDISTATTHGKLRLCTAELANTAGGLFCSVCCFTLNPSFHLLYFSDRSWQVLLQGELLQCGCHCPSMDESPRHTAALLSPSHSA